MSVQNQTSAKQTSKTALAVGTGHLAVIGGNSPGSNTEKTSMRLARGAKRLTVAIGREAAANFKSWFKRNFANTRAGRIGGTSYHRAGAMDDRPGDWTWYTDAYGRAFYDHTEPLTPDEEDYLRSHPLVMLQLALGVTDLRGLRCLRRGLTLRTNALQRKSYRSRYYTHDNARRRALAAERRKIHRRTTTNPCPTPDEFREAFARVTDSAEAKVFFGGMVHDLACYVDSCLRYDRNGNIVGRNGGIRAWLADNVPELSPRYKTIMRYKALAMRVRQMMDLTDPTPTSALLECVTNRTPEPETHSPREASIMQRTSCNETGEIPDEDGSRVENYYAQDSHNVGRRYNVRKRKIGNHSARGLDLGCKKPNVSTKTPEKIPDMIAREQERANIAREQERANMTREQERANIAREQERANMTRKQNSLYLAQKQERLKQMLAGCRNSFRDVFGKIDSELS